MALKKANQEISPIDRKKMDCIIRDLAMEITVGGDRFDRLYEKSRCEFRNEVESMLKLMDHKKLRPVMQADISKKVKVTNNVSL